MLGLGFKGERRLTQPVSIELTGTDVPVVIPTHPRLDTVEEPISRQKNIAKSPEGGHMGV